MNVTEKYQSISEEGRDKDSITFIPKRSQSSHAGLIHTAMSNACFQPVHKQPHPLSRAIFFASHAKSVAAFGEQVHFDGYFTFDTLFRAER